MGRALKAGISYYAVIFAAAFVLGTLRVQVVASSLGDVAAVAIELPLILALSWIVSRWLIARFDVAAELIPRLAMGAIAFAILMVSEAGVSILGFGRTLPDHLARYRELSAILGLAGQGVFAALPVIQLVAGRR